MYSPNSHKQDEDERRYQVERAITTVKNGGGIVNPFVRQLYDCYVVGELSIQDVCTHIDAQAAEQRSLVNNALGWVY